QDDTFYFDNVVFQVSYVLFKLPRQLLAGSGVFADMFALPPRQDGQEEGRDNEHAIKLPGITAEEFRGFLRTIYPMTYDVDDVRVADRETWLSCLKLATQWNIDRMRKKAICKLDQYGWDAIDKIVTAKRYHVSRWLIEGYIEVLQRHRLSVEEVRRLVPIFGMETVCLL
ncbi:uncharacterized protein STEHIDRAFT_29499, partial [Stereum hirsutum FP-91666 SS1]|uniref:uncharacterized protein n=1 Tax=Stereum hirsutum (strain FP-91666) TaxID=721885 RepID=UPI000440C841